MQIATVHDARPWICTVYYVADENQNIYWLSWPSRRHSQEIIKNPNIAVAIVVKTDQPVIGMQIEGRAEIVEDITVIENIMELYIAQHGQGQDFVDNYKAGSAQHRMYRLTPKSIVLLDEVHFKETGRTIWEPNA
ncbi:MAG: hypothetical protein JWL85_281 [Candidatus Saccharibacteria bacterium]|nr:hypothetical protein [Candidatus Saccharibacteria bacterium]